MTDGIKEINWKGVIGYNLENAGKILEVDPSTIHHWIKDGKLKAIKKAGRYLITRDFILDFQEKMMIPTNQKGK